LLNFWGIVQNCGFADCFEIILLRDAVDKT
jgi:hypothetical protein